MGKKTASRTIQEPKKKQNRWIIATESVSATEISLDSLRSSLLLHRGLQSPEQIQEFLHPKNPMDFTPNDVSIDEDSLNQALTRIKKAIQDQESIVVYADYDADGITAGTIMWETLHGLGANVMPYIPHRVEEGYGLSQKGIDSIIELYKPTLIVTVDHGITGSEKVAYAKDHGIDVIVTDHHTKGSTLPDCIIVHTTQLCGAGVSWFVSKELTGKLNSEHLALAAIGTVADLVPLMGPNRSIVKFGLKALNTTKRVGLLALIEESGYTKGELEVYNISHGLAPRLNAMGRLEHAMDALRLLCTSQEDKAMLLARKIALTNKDRQQITTDSASHAKDIVNGRVEESGLKKLLFVADASYNQGVIGLIAGKLVEEFYRPSIVLAKGETISKASARSIAGFNIVEAIRKQSDILIDVGGHPMAAGFTIETKHLDELQKRLEELANQEITDEMLIKSLRIEHVLPLSMANTQVWELMQEFQPFGFGNFEPQFVSRNVLIDQIRLIGKDNKHLKIRVKDSAAVSSGSGMLDAVAFNFGHMYGELQSYPPVDIAYTVDMNVWNGKSSIQLKIKDIQIRLMA